MRTTIPIATTEGSHAGIYMCRMYDAAVFQIILQVAQALAVPGVGAS